MIIFLYGQDSYRIGQKLKEIVSGYKAKNPSGLNFVSLDFPENNLDDLTSIIISDSLIPEKKLIIVKNILEINPASLTDFLKKSDIGSDRNVILIAISFEAPDGKNELFK